MDEIRRRLRAPHVEWILRQPWGLSLARARAESCTIRPDETRPAYAALADHMESDLGKKTGVG